MSNDDPSTTVGHGAYPSSLQARRVGAVVPHWGRGFPRISWTPDAEGHPSASGQGWDAVVRPCPGGGHEVLLTIGEDSQVYPAEAGGPERSEDGCKRWVRTSLIAAGDRARWAAYIGRPSPKHGRRRESWVRGR